MIKIRLFFDSCKINLTFFLLRGKNKEDETAVGMLFHDIASETYLFSLCRDGNVRLWSTLRNQCNLVTDFTLAENEGGNESYFPIYCIYKWILCVNDFIYSSEPHDT